MKKLFKYASGLFLTGALSVMVVFNVNAQRGAAHAGGGGGGSTGGGGGGLSVSRGGFGGGSSIGGGSSLSVGRGGFGRSTGFVNTRPAYGVGYGWGNPYLFNYGLGWGYPSLGLYYNTLPFGYYPFYMGASMFYYADGTFYQPYDNGYVVTAPPVGAAVPGLPRGAKRIMIDGKEFYEFRGIYYKAIVNDKGDTVYVVAGKDGELNTQDGGGETGFAMPQVGDIVTDLPANPRSVTLNRKKYYVVDDVYYEAITVNGKTAYRIASVPEQ